MTRKHQCARLCAIVEHLAAADARLRGVGVLREIPVGIIDLQKMMPHIADESGTLAPALQLEENVAGGMAWRRIDLDEIVQPIRAAANQIGFSVLKNRDHTFTERAEFGRPFPGVGINL